MKYQTRHTLLRISTLEASNEHIHLLALLFHRSAPHKSLFASVGLTNTAPKELIFIQHMRTQQKISLNLTYIFPFFEFFTHGVISSSAFFCRSRTPTSNAEARGLTCTYGRCTITSVLLGHHQMVNLSMPRWIDLTSSACLLMSQPPSVVLLRKGN
ncbi:hypothetical protein EI94DRAFT_889177 [Lactarius quietus]|nr:hypothetical protein EI94DRAFT_889177 [Lactarius quietus]